jgi:ABC-type multidrug transport system ATPase subunit
MITVESLTRRYAGFIAVDNVSFAVKPGRVTGFPGPNGAAKSITMRVMVGLTARASGWATIDGVRFADLGGFLGYVTARQLPNPGLEVGGARERLARSCAADLGLGPFLGGGPARRRRRPDDTSRRRLVGSAGPG